MSITDLDEALISPGEATREFYREQGRREEQERIIKLLEAFDTCYCAEEDPNPKHYRCGTNQGLIPQEIIALIKGEK